MELSTGLNFFQAMMVKGLHISSIWDHILDTFVDLEVPAGEEVVECFVDVVLMVVVDIAAAELAVVAAETAVGNRSEYW